MESLTPSPDDENKDISQSSVEEKEDLASEKLIKVYIQQGYHQKAIEAYEKLSLKYPEKSDYFAEQIEKIKQTINQQKK
jgi:DNA-binding SARP family transcriptional activator